LLPLKSRTSSSPGACARCAARQSRRGDFPRSDLHRSSLADSTTPAPPAPSTCSRPLGARIANDLGERFAPFAEWRVDRTAVCP